MAKLMGANRVAARLKGLNSRSVEKRVRAALYAAADIIRVDAALSISEGAVILVPAPTIAAAVFKADLIHAEEAWNDSSFEADCMSIITSDFARLTATSPDRTGWDALLAAFGNAKAAIDRHNAEEAPSDEPSAVAHGKESERLALVHAERLDAVLLAPAPDCRALCQKLQIFNDWQVEDGWQTAREIVEQLAADARNLLGEA